MRPVQFHADSLVALIDDQTATIRVFGGETTRVTERTIEKIREATGFLVEETLVKPRGSP